MSKKKTLKDGDLLSNCCAWDFDPFGAEKDDVWQERCLKCGRLCEPLYLGYMDIKNIRRLSELDQPRPQECSCDDYVLFKGCPCRVHNCQPQQEYTQCVVNAKTGKMTHGDNPKCQLQQEAEDREIVICLEQAYECGRLGHDKWHIASMKNRLRIEQQEPLPLQGEQGEQGEMKCGNGLDECQWDPSMHRTPTAPSDWELRFKELFQPQGTALKYVNVNNFVVVEEILKFIRQLLEKERERMIEVVEFYFDNKEFDSTDKEISDAIRWTTKIVRKEVLSALRKERK